MYKKIHLFGLGIALIIAAIWLLVGGRADDDISVLDRLPDYDYIAEINDLMQQKRWGEAKTICEDVIALDLPSANKARELQAKCQLESGKIYNRLYKAGKGFITGEPDGSLEELGGSVVSDMLMYGDIRDLVKQGYFKLTNRETDPVITALAAAGLLTEFVDVADWAPAALKAFRKIGAITDSLGRYIIKTSADIFKTGKIDSACKNFFLNLKTMLNNTGFIRSSRIIKYAQSADDVAILAASAKTSPHATHLVASTANERTVEVIEAVNKHKDSPALLKKIARKGANSLKLISRTGKILHKGHPAEFLRQMLGGYFYLLSLFIIIAGIWLIYRSVKKSSVPMNISTDKIKFSFSFFR